MTAAASLSPAWLAWPQTQRLLAAYAGSPGALRFVGGAVRDALLGIDAKDVDAATQLLPEAVMEVLRAAGIPAIPTGLAHGTVTAVVDGRHFEITTLRRDTACDGRHAEVEYTDDWREDASRRDFTMNALYLSPGGELFDYFHGAEDARAGRVHFIGEAHQRISEDYLRILRFFRFHAWYGKGEPDAQALAACEAQAAHMDALSGERVQHELLRLMAAPRAAAALELMRSHGFMPHVIGFGVQGCAVFARLEAMRPLVPTPFDPAFPLAGLVVNAAISQPEALGMVYSRLRLSNRAEKMLRQCVRYYADLPPGLPPAQQKRLLRKLGADAFTDAVLLAWAQGSEPITPASPYMNMLALAREWQAPQFPLTGHDLLENGFPSGRGMGELLARLEEQWESSGYALGKQELLDRARQ